MKTTTKTTINTSTKVFFVRLSIGILLLSLLVFVNAYAQPVSTSFWGDTAIGGKDTTAYHNPEVIKVHKEVNGSDKFEVEYLGAKWHFANQVSADKFAKDPKKYIPQFNGFCANALALGEGLIKTDGTVWNFFGDDLYLFYAEGGRKRWLSGNYKEYLKTARTAWQKEISK